MDEADKSSRLTPAERRRLAEDRRIASAWRIWNAKTEVDQDFDRLRSLALEKAAFALMPIMKREGLDLVAPGELAQAAVEEFERVMKQGTVNGKRSI